MGFQETLYMKFNKKQSSDLEDVNTNTDFEQMLQESFGKSDRKLKAGDKIKAEVLSAGKEFVIVSTGTRYDGFVPSNLLTDQSGKLKVKAGDVVELYVTHIKGSEIYLSPDSRRNLIDDKKSSGRTQTQQTFNAGDRFTGKVTRVENFGAFIEIAPGVEGLAHVSELSWKRINSPADVLKVGDTVHATVLRVEYDTKKTKISLTLKDAAQNPWANLPSQVQVGRVVSGKITRLMDFGAFVELQPGLEGLIPLSAMSATRRAQRADEFVQVGQEVAVMVKDINTESKRISLSIKDAQSQAASMSESEDIKAYADKLAAQEASQGMGALGAKIQAALSKKKS